MHCNVALDALPGSARLVRVLDSWLNDWIHSCFEGYEAKNNPFGKVVEQLVVD